MMKSILLLAGLMIGSVSASAYARVYTTNHTCSEVKNIVRTYGAVVLYTSAYTYDRYVYHGGYCALGEVTHAAWVPTADNASCLIGYTCGQRDSGR
jgi:hypothetical protein